MPVDWYNGGMEHTTLHLLYSRFWHKFLYDIGAVTCPEPYAKRTSHGMILGETGEKMSKSRGNVVNPDDIVNEYGADTMRMYEMFMGDFEKAAPWSQSSIKGCKRFLDKIWNLQEIVVEGEEYSEDMVVPFNKTIKKVTEDIQNLGFNTAIAAMMALLNEIGAKKAINKAEYRTLLILLNPFAPHITEEIWENMGFGGQIAQAQWPTFDEAKCVEATVEIPVQINGKIRARIHMALDLSKDDMLSTALSDEAIKAATEGKAIVKTICVPNKLVNIVVK
jgi:leucyl-tRNA synthetase